LRRRHDIISTPSQISRERGRLFEGPLCQESTPLVWAFRRTGKFGAIVEIDVCGFEELGRFSDVIEYELIKWVSELFRNVRGAGGRLTVPYLKDQGM
jgi:hypothetical protein